MAQAQAQAAKPSTQGATSVGALLQQVPYPKVSSDQLLQQITLDCLFNAYTYGKDPQRDQAVAKAVERLTHVPFDSGFVAGFEQKGVTPSILFGPPGHGKSSLVKAAAKKAAGLLGMRFVEDFEIAKDQLPGPNDYLFITREMAGQVSATSLTGIPSKATLETGEHYMNMLPERAFVLTKNAGACVLLLDDVANAHPSIIPALLNVVNERRYGQHRLERALPVLTANLGASMDGAVGVSRLGTALVNRAACYAVADDLEDWIKRYEFGLGGRGDYGFSAFLRLNPELFSMAPPTGVDTGPFVSSRSLENFARRLPLLVKMATAGSEVNVAPLQTFAQALLGSHAAEKIAGFYAAYLSGAFRIAGEWMRSGLDPKTERQLLDEVAQRGTGHTPQHGDFRLQLAASLADQVAARFVAAVQNSGVLNLLSQQAGQSSGKQAAVKARHLQQVGDLLESTCHRAYQLLPGLGSQTAVMFTSMLVSRLFNQLPEAMSDYSENGFRETVARRVEQAMEGAGFSDSALAALRVEARGYLTGTALVSGVRMN